MCTGLLGIGGDKPDPLPPPPAPAPVTVTKPMVSPEDAALTSSQSSGAVRARSNMRRSLTIGLNSSAAGTGLGIPQ